MMDARIDGGMDAHPNEIATAARLLSGQGVREVWLFEDVWSHGT
jgi:hypothetical protein